MSGLYNYSPITSRPAGSWPGGRSLAVYLCLGVEEYRFGDGHTEDILPGVPAPDPYRTCLPMRKTTDHCAIPPIPVHTR